MSDKGEGLVWFLWVVSQLERVARLQREENRLLRCLHLAVVPLARFILVREPEAAAVWVLAWNFVVRNKKGAIRDFEWTSVRPFPKIAG